MSHRLCHFHHGTLAKCFDDLTVVVIAGVMGENGKCGDCIDFSRRLSHETFKLTSSRFDSGSDKNSGCVITCRELHDDLIANMLMACRPYLVCVKLKSFNSSMLRVSRLTKSLKCVNWIQKFMQNHLPMNIFLFFALEFTSFKYFTSLAFALAIAWIDKSFEKICELVLIL